MNTALSPVVKRFLALAVFLSAVPRVCLGAPTPDSPPDDIEGRAYKLERAYLVVVHVPSADVDRVMKAVVGAVGLEYGKFDRVAYIDAQGVELFRALGGSKAGAQSRVARAPTRVVSFPSFTTQRCCRRPSTRCTLRTVTRSR